MEMGGRSEDSRGPGGYGREFRARAGGELQKRGRGSRPRRRLLRWIWWRKSCGVCVGGWWLEGLRLWRLLAYVPRDRA